MTRRLLCMVAILTTLMAATISDTRASVAQSFVPAPSQSFYVDLDTQDGHFSEWRHNDLGPFSILRATVNIKRLGQDPKWLPAFTFWLNSKGSGSKAHTLGLRLSTENSNPPLVLQIIWVDAGKASAGELLHKTVGLNESVNIEINWGTHRKVVFRVGDAKTQQLDIPWAVDSMSISASTGEIEVSRLEFGSPGH